MTAISPLRLACQVDRTNQAPARGLYNPDMARAVLRRSPHQASVIDADMAAISSCAVQHLHSLVGDCCQFNHGDVPSVADFSRHMLSGSSAKLTQSLAKAVSIFA